jgi:hypothetical protein
MALPNRVPQAATPPDIGKMSVEDRLKLVVESAASRLAPSVGRQLLTLIEPKSLAIMAAVLVAWTGAQFLGVGEIADFIVLIGGYAMLGGVAVQAARLLFESARLVIQAKDKKDIDTAGAILAEVVSLIGVQGTLALLLSKPKRRVERPVFRIS